MSDYVLALDAGGTNTKCWVVARDGTVAGAAVAGPGNHILGGLDTVRQSFASAVSGALAAAQGAAGQVAAVVAGCSGIEAAGETGGPIERILDDLLPDVPVRHAVGDMIVAFHGALPRGVGVVVLSGTGATSYGRDANGRATQVDGWGHLLGDAGSAYAIGQAALRCAAAAVDERGPATVLAERIPAALGADSLRAVAYTLYDAPDVRTRVAGLARTVAAAANTGDPVAQSLLSTAGTALGQAGAAALRRLALDREPADVATAGAVFQAGPPLTNAFAAVLLESAPAARIVQPALPPVGGAAKLAWEAAGGRWSAEQVARAQATQPTEGARNAVE